MAHIINEAIIIYCGRPAKVACDRNCTKAWGINNRPRVQLSNNEDDYAFLADDELGDAPTNPGTYEGADGKPESPDDFPNKWCVRECERCSMSRPGEPSLPLELKTFTSRRPNIFNGRPADVAGEVVEVECPSCGRKFNVLAGGGQFTVCFGCNKPLN